jgi:putative tricarboxylic transport membrane protein
MSVKRVVIILSSVCLVVGILYVIEAFSYGMGKLGRPGAALFPVCVGILFTLSALGTGIDAIRNPSQKKLELPKGSYRRNLLLIMAATLGYAIVFPFSGYLLAGALLTLAALHSMGVRSWFYKVGVAIAMTLASYILFEVVLGVPLPKGILPI